MKKIVFCFVLIMCSVLFTGCSTISVSPYVNTKFTSIYVTITYDADNLAQIGIDSPSDISLIRDTIEDKSEVYMNQMLKKYKNIINVLHANGVLTSNEKIIYRNHLNMYSGWDGTSYIIEMRFYTTTASRFFIRYGDVVEDSTVEKGFFTTKITEQYTGIFTTTPNNIITTSVSDYFTGDVSDVIHTNFGEVAKEGFAGLDVGYLFLTTNTRLRSDGVVIPTTEGDVHYFEDGAENVFTFYRIEANRYIWYLSALTSVMVFVAVSLVVIYFKKK